MRTSGAFSVTFMKSSQIKRMFNKNEQWESLCRDIEATISKYHDVINLSFMGFPPDWKEALNNQ